MSKKPMTKYNTLTRYNNFLNLELPKKYGRQHKNLDLNDWKVKNQRWKVR